ncbi:hypothetical protein, partial [Dietzia maris]|uniref:hypothetical protein n=1 Tax=Dietzia maris TaxID=37915 RepID=UPI001D03B0AD
TCPAEYPHRRVRGGIWDRRSCSMWMPPSWSRPVRWQPATVRKVYVGQDATALRETDQRGNATPQ